MTFGPFRTVIVGENPSSLPGLGDNPLEQNALYGSGAHHLSLVPPVGTSLDGERAAHVIGTVTEVGKAACGDFALDATPVVDDLDAQLVLDGHADGETWWLPRGAHIANRFPHNSFCMIGKCRVDDGEWARELHRGAHLGIGKLFDRGRPALS